MVRITQLNDPIKYCRVCSCELILDDNWSEASQGHSQYICRSCHNKRVNKWRDVNPESRRISVKKWQDANPDYMNEYMNCYRKTPKGKDVIHKAHRKQHANRKGYKDTELFPNPFADYVSIRWHHVSDEFIVAIPTDIHVLYTGFKEHRELVMNVVNQIYIGLMKKWQI